MDDSRDFTRLLNLAAQGDAHAASVVLPQVVRELRAIARRRLAQLPPGQTLQPTALVNEVWVRLAEGDREPFETRRHFRFVAARAIRDILVEDSRRKGANKRGGGLQRVEIEDFHIVVESPVDDMLALDAALCRLEHEDAAGYRIVMLRFFTGLEMSEIAAELETSLSTVERKWRFVRAWLRSELAGGSDA